MDTTVRNNASLPLRGARIAITGGTSGLGLSLVRECMTRGAAVAFIARTRDRVERVAEEIRLKGRAPNGGPEALAPFGGSVAKRRSGGTIHGIVGDIARKDDIHSFALQILGTLGGLDVLVNNASSLGPTPLALLADTECEDFETALATNVLGPFRLTKALLGALAASARERRGSVVLNISSDAAINPYAGWGAYGASKAALHQLSRIWNEELGEDGIRFLSVDPGDMDTPLHALAVPDADRTTLKRPEIAARELADKIALALASLRATRASDQAESASVA